MKYATRRVFTRQKYLKDRGMKMRFIKKMVKNNPVTLRYYKKILKLRKKALSFLSGVAPKYVSKVMYKSAFKRKLNLDNPMYFNEKLMWLKINQYANDPLVIQGADKYKVREYVKNCGLSEILNGLIGVWDSAEEIDWDSLPEKFAIKCNHGCGFNIICRNKNEFDVKAATKKLNKWLKKGSWREYAELHYRHITPKIICEEFLAGKNGDLPVDYKFYCFNGEPLYIGNFIERNMEEGTIIRGYFDLDWSPSDVFKDKDKMDATKFPRPENLEKMIEYAKILSKPFPFVRVDFYDVGGKVVFGELTFTPTGCLGTYYSDDAYLKLGNSLKI